MELTLLLWLKFNPSFPRDDLTLLALHQDAGGCAKLSSSALLLLKKKERKKRKTSTANIFSYFFCLCVWFSFAASSDFFKHNCNFTSPSFAVVIFSRFAPFCYGTLLSYVCFCRKTYRQICMSWQHCRNEQELKTIFDSSLWLFFSVLFYVILFLLCSVVNSDVFTGYGLFIQRNT